MAWREKGAWSLTTKIYASLALGISFVGFFGTFDNIAPQSGQNLAPVLTECGGIWYFRDSADEPHFPQNCWAYLSIFVLYM